MEKQFQLLTITRKNILNEMESCSPEQLFQIPSGFNNHILWNVIHIPVTQQLLWYGNTKTPFRLEEAIINQYKKGTIPTQKFDSSLIELAKKTLTDTLSQGIKDYENQIFGPYNPVTTSYGVALNSIEDAITFTNLHESMHFGQIKMLKKLVS